MYSTHLKYSMPQYVLLSSVLAWAQPASLKHSKIKIDFASDKLVFVSSPVFAKYRLGVPDYVSNLHQKNEPLQAPFHLPVKEETERKAQRGEPVQSPKVQMERNKSRIPGRDFGVSDSSCVPLHAGLEPTSNSRWEEETMRIDTW